MAQVLVALFVCSSVWLAAAAASSVELVPVALSNQQVPGAPPGVVYGTFSLFGTGSFHDSGALAFGSAVSGAGVTPDNDAVVVGPDGTGGLTLRLRENEPALPGGVVFAGMTPFVDSAGNLIVVAGLRGPGVVSTNDTAVFHVPLGSSPILIFREGDPVPAGGTLPGFDVMRFADDGSVAFTTGSSTAIGFWMASPSNGVVRIAMQGQQAPGFPPGTNLSNNISGTRFYAATSGELAFAGLLSTTSAGVVWGPDGAGGVAVVAQGGDPVPGEVPGSVFRGSGPPVQEPDGRLTFTGYFQLPGSGNYVEAIFQHGQGGITQRVREGNPAPGTSGVFANRIIATGFEPFDPFLQSPVFPNQGGFGFLDGAPAVNASGDIAFLAGLSPNSCLGGSPGDTGIWSTVGGVLQLRACEGDPVPGLPGVRFGDNGSSASGAFGFSAPNLNDAGDVLFKTNLQGPGVVSGVNDDAVIAVEAGGTLHVIARKGGPLEVAPGDVRTIQNMNVFVGAYGSFQNTFCCWQSLSNTRQIALSMIYTNGSGLFLASLAPPTPGVPLAPWPWLLAAASAIALWARRSSPRL